MKRLLFTLAVIVNSLMSASAQQTASKPKLSGFTQQYLLATRKPTGKNKLIPNYVYKSIDNKTYISALIKVSSDIDEGQLSSLGVFIGTKAGNIWTAQVPVENVTAFTKISGISYIGLDAPIFPVLDSARKETRADSAQKGINLPVTATGRNVIVGIIDAGFDFNHPTMFDTTNGKFRIKKVWAQKMPGTHPTGFAYGHEMTDSNVIKVRGSDTAILSHGTHVTGIAAGSGYGSNANSRYRGMAFESDIVLVGIMPAPGEWVSAGESDIIDGMNYIYTYAASVGKPAVVNLSWGATLGPHDGNSLFSQACDALTGAGKIFVCAAGNNGEDTVHLQQAFTSTDTTVSTFVTFSPYLDSNNQFTWVDAWGDTGKTFCLNVKLYDTTAAIDSTGFVCVSADTTRSFNLIGSNGDTCFVTISTTPSEYNDKPHAFIEFYSKVHNNICLTAKAADGVLDMWEGYVFPPEGYYGYFKKLGYPWAVSGDAKYTVSDIGCTRSAITAGAYTSKTSFVNINGSSLYYPGAVHGHIAPFSSFGPTEDFRIKPDITAPGFALASAVNSYDTSYNSTGTNYLSVVRADTGSGGRIYRYAMLAGTSMASPCVAGIVGMMLQLNPTLTPDETKTIINTTAIKDTYTGVLPASGTTTWGHGKINAYGAIKYLAQQLSVESKNIDPLDCILYPNPNKGGFTIDYISKTQEQLKVEIFDIAGKLIHTQRWAVNEGYNSRVFSISGLSKGLYFTKVSSGDGFNVIKTVVE